MVVKYFGPYKLHNQLSDPEISRVNLEMMSYEDVYSVVDGKIFTLKFSKNDFIGKLTQMDGNVESDWWFAFDKDYIEQYNKRVINKAKIIIYTIFLIPNFFQTY